MENLKSKTDSNLGFGNTVKYSKTFNTNVNGRDITIGLYRRVITKRVFSEEFKSKTYFTLEYNNEHFGHNDMDRDTFNFYLNMINEGRFDR